MIINWLPAALLSSARPSARHTRRGRTRQQSKLRLENVESRLLLAGSVHPTWNPDGPEPMDGGAAALGIANNPTVGAIRAIVVDPSNSNTVYVATVNGGIWKTTDASDPNPIWTAETDTMPSLSTSSLSMDPGNDQVLVAGIGRYSGDANDGGPLTGVQLTTNGGGSWTSLDGGGTLKNVNISAVLVRNGGSTIIVASAQPPLSAPVSGTTGIYRSIDGGLNFSLLSNDGSSGLPAGDVFDMVADPNTPATMYAAVGSVASGAGIYKSVDNGAHWVKISNATQDGELSSAANTQENAKIAVGKGGVVDLIIDDTVNTKGVNTSSDFIYQYNGSTWTTLGTPFSVESPPPAVEGLHPAGMGMLYLSIAADINNSNILYVGGDQQPGPFTNSIGSTSANGRLFRIDASLPGLQFTALTNKASTNNNTSPPANSMFMVTDSTGRLLEADGGGIYVRTNPTAKGDWSSMNSNLQDAEMLQAGYASADGAVIGTTQGNGTGYQVASGVTWTALNAGPGGSIGVDNQSFPGEARVFSGGAKLQGFGETDFNGAGAISGTAAHNLIDTVSSKSLINGAADPTIAVSQGIVLNSVDPTHGLVLTANVWESLDSFNTVKNAFTMPSRVTAAIYGGVLNGVSDAGVLIVGDGSGNLDVRQSQAAAVKSFALPPAAGGAGIQAIAVDPRNWTQAFILDTKGEIWTFSYDKTTGAGTFSASPLATLGAPTGNGYQDWRTLTAVPVGTNFELLAGGYGGIYTVNHSNGAIQQFGTLPNAIVNSVTYNAAADVLVAGTLGRGTFTVSNASTFLPPIVTIPISSVTYNGVSGSSSGSPVILALGAQIFEPIAQVDFAGGNLTVRTTNGASGDVLSIEAGGGIATVGNVINYSGHQIGTFLGGSGSTPLVVTLSNNGFETTAAVEALMSQIGFSSTSVSNTPRTVGFQITDAQPQTSAEVFVGVNMVVAPVVTIPTSTVTFNTPPGTPVILATGATVTDAVGADFSNGNLTVTTTNGVAGDALTIEDGSSITTSAGSVFFNGKQIGSFSGGTGSTPLVVTFANNGSESTAAIQALIGQIAFGTTSGSLTARNVTFQVTDSQPQTSASAAVTVNVVNTTLPSLTIPTGSVTFNTPPATPVILAAGATVTEPVPGIDFRTGNLTVATTNGVAGDKLAIQAGGGITTAGSNVSFGGNLIGTFTGGSGSTPLVVTFVNNGFETTAAVQALVRQITFGSSSLSPVARDVSFQITDSRPETSAAVDVTVNVVITNIPVVTIPSNNVTFTTPPDIPVILATGATVTDPVAGADFHNGKLTVTVTNGVAGDSVAIQNAGTISTSGNVVSFNGNQIGTFAGGSGNVPFVVTFLNNGFETKAAVQALVRHITFGSSSFSATARNVTFQVTDSQPQSSLPVAVTVNVVLQNEPILVIDPGPVTLNNAPTGQPVLLAPGSILIDSASFQGGELSVTVSNNGSPNDQLLVQSIGGITLNGNSVLYNGNVIGVVGGGFAGSPLVVQFTTADADTAAVLALVEAIAFNDTVDPVSTAQRTVTFQVVDSLHNSSNNDNVLVNVNTADIPPVVSLNTQFATYTEGSFPVTLAPGAAISYSDGTNFPGGSLTVSLSANGTPSDLLTIQSVGGITLSGANVLFNNNIIGSASGGTNGNPLVITFTSPQATVAAAQALIRAVGFSNSSNNPSTVPRTAEFVINDGRGGLSAAVSMTVNVIPVDNSPILVLGPSAPYSANSPAGAIAPSATVTDPDSPFFVGGTLVVSESLGSPNDQLVVLNQGNGAHQISVSGTSVFDAGTLIGTITSLGSPSSPLAVALNGNASLDDVQDLVRAVGFGINGAATSQTRFFSFSLNDGGGAPPAVGNTSVSVNLSNSSPIVVLQPAANYTSGSVPMLVSPISVVSDPDSLDFNGGSLMVTLAQGGTLNDRLSIQSQGAVLVNGQNVFYGGVLVGTLTAGAGFGLTPLVVNFNSQSTAAAAQAILGAVQFSTTGPQSAGVRFLQATVTDNHQLTSTPATEQINVSLPADPVTLTLSSPTTTAQRGNRPIFIDSGAILSDINATTFPGGSLIFQVRGGTKNHVAIANTLDIHVKNGKVSYDGLVIGKLQGGTVHLNANATVSAVQALIQSVTFSTRGIPGNRTATFMFKDGVGGLAFASRTIIVN